MDIRYWTKLEAGICMYLLGLYISGWVCTWLSAFASINGWLCWGLARHIHGQWSSPHTAHKHIYRHIQYSASHIYIDVHIHIYIYTDVFMYTQTQEQSIVVYIHVHHVRVGCCWACLVQFWFHLLKHAWCILVRHEANKTYSRSHHDIICVKTRHTTRAEQPYNQTWQLMRVVQMCMSLRHTTHGTRMAAPE
jgi:hypothetical protein